MIVFRAARSLRASRLRSSQPDFGFGTADFGFRRNESLGVVVRGLKRKSPGRVESEMKRFVLCQEKPYELYAEYLKRFSPVYASPNRAPVLKHLGLHLKNPELV
jgi:hypothetical protein